MAEITCIDISTYQKNVNFNRVKASGIDSVIMRAGYGRELSQKDNEFETHYRNARAANMRIGAYWYSYAESVADAEREANTCLRCISGKSFDMPIFYDLEDSSMTSLGRNTLTEIAKRFCETIKKSGYRAGVYANLNWFNNYLNYNDLKSRYSIWLAQYYTTNQLSCDIWQNSSTGSVPGVSGNVDTNIVFNDDVYGPSDPSEPPETGFPTAEYRVRTKGRWLPPVKDLEDYAGLIGSPITDVALRFSVGTVRYRVHIKGGRWLPYVNGYDITDIVNGYAGNGTEIDAIEVYYFTPNSIVSKSGYLKAKYRVSPQNGGYYPYQYDDERTNGQDGYAGLFTKSIDRFQLTLE